MDNSDVDRLQSTDAHAAFGENGVGINEDVQLAEYTEQQTPSIR